MLAAKVGCAVPSISAGRPKGRCGKHAARRRGAWVTAPGRSTAGGEPGARPSRWPHRLAAAGSCVLVVRVVTAGIGRSAGVRRPPDTPLYARSGGFASRRPQHFQRRPVQKRRTLSSRFPTHGFASGGTVVAPSTAALVRKADAMRGVVFLMFAILSDRCGDTILGNVLRGKVKGRGKRISGAGETPDAVSNRRRRRRTRRSRTKRVRQRQRRARRA